MVWLLCVVSDVLVKMPYVDGELPVYWWDSEADRCMVIGIFRHGMCMSVCVSAMLLYVVLVVSEVKFLPARRYASAGLCDSDVSVQTSVCHTPVLCLAERKQDREMYTI